MKQLFLIFSMVIVLFSCRKSYECNKQDEITYENIPDSNISQIPYTGNELISFVNETGDTAVFKCTGYKNYYSTVKKSEGGKFANLFVSGELARKK